MHNKEGDHFIEENKAFYDSDQNPLDESLNVNALYKNIFLSMKY